MAFSIVGFFVLLAQLAGGESPYIVQPGVSLTTVGARLGVDVRVIAEANEMKVTSPMSPGQFLRIDNRHVVPESSGEEIVINVPQRMLFYFQEGMAPRQYPIAAGRASWQTPIAASSIAAMEENPVWDVPLSIQEEMRAKGKPVVTRVPPSRRNPLGKYWIGLSLPGIGIHGTNAPLSIYKLQTHGCIRLHPEDIRDLFSLVDIGTRVRIVYEPVLLAKVGDAVFLEVHPDPYKRGANPLLKAYDIARTEGFSGEMDWTLVKDVIRKHDGIARDVTSAQARAASVLRNN
jgi:L,D-transpeptidase ErfK/SrfK